MPLGTQFPIQNVILSLFANAEIDNILRTLKRLFW
jgi:hypothetical protein